VYACLFASLLWVCTSQVDYSSFWVLHKMTISKLFQLSFLFQGPHLCCFRISETQYDSCKPFAKKFEVKYKILHHIMLSFTMKVCKIAVSTPKSGHLILPYRVQDDLWLILHWNWEIPTVTYFLGLWIFTGVIPSSSAGSCPCQEMITTMVLMMSSLSATSGELNTKNTQKTHQHYSPMSSHS
jgi:hypothetical protein